VLALSLINIALEAGGEALGASPPLVNTLQGELCKHLLHNSQTDEPTILSLTLRVVFNLFSSIKDHLKVQLEVFLTSVHLRIVDGGSAAKGGAPAPPPTGAPAGGASGASGVSIFSPEVRARTSTSVLPLSTREPTNALFSVATRARPGITGRVLPRARAHARSLHQLRL